MRRPVTTEGAVSVGHPISTGQGAPETWDDRRATDVCTCGAFLNRYNPGPLCGPCKGRADGREEPKARNGTNPRPDQDFLDALREGPCTATELARRLRGSYSRTKERLRTLVKDGRVEVAERNHKSGYVYRLKKGAT